MKHLPGGPIVWMMNQMEKMNTNPQKELQNFEFYIIRSLPGGPGGPGGP